MAIIKVTYQLYGDKLELSIHILFNYIKMNGKILQQPALSLFSCKFTYHIRLVQPNVEVGSNPVVEPDPEL